MLTGTNNHVGATAVATLPSEIKTTRNAASSEPPTGSTQSRLAKALRIEWLGQTIASICWIASVFVYGISSTGDWLQLGAASAWLVANIAAIAAAETE
ncbi:MAG: hypothetical protein AAGF31_02565 [Planctomycetota bacterium]